MAKASPGYTSFNAGEWSPIMAGRFDLEKYSSACAAMVNFMPKIQGPAQRRPGTKFVVEVEDSANFTRVIPFEFNVTQAYIVQAGDQKFRFIREHGQIVSGTPVEVVTPYSSADLPKLKFIQSADVLYLFHPDYMPQKLARTSHVDWAVTAIAPHDGPYLPANVTATTLTPSAATGTGITLTASAVTGINGDGGFNVTDIGRIIRIKEGAAWGWVTITGFTSTTVVTVTVERTLTNTNAKTEWRLGLYSDTTGYPSCGAFYEDRLVLGGVREFPQRFDLSRTGDYENFQPTDVDGTVVADHALAFTVNANNVNVIRWILDDEKGLLLGTVGGEWVLRPAAVNEALSAANLPQVRRATTWGSADIQALKAGNAVVFVQRSARKLLEIAYFFEDDGFRSGDVTELAEHITAGGITELVYQREPDSTMWAVRNDGTLLGMTYRREQSVYGWHRHILGGMSDADGTQAKVESIAVIPSPDGARDELYMVVQRYIDGGVKRYIEYMAAPLPDDGDQEDAFYVDCGLTYDAASASVISGFDHLEGETIQLLVDGASHPDEEVSSGDVTLDRAAAVVQGGLAYDHLSELQTLSVEAGARDGTAQGKTKRVTNCTIRFHRSRGVKAGPDSDTLDPLPELMYRDPSTAMGTPDPLFTGDSLMLWPAGYEGQAKITVVPEGALPCVVVGVYPQLVTQDR